MPSIKMQNPNIDVEWFKQKLEEKRMTVRGLAKRMDLHPSTVSLMLRGIRSIHNPDAIKLADIFNVTPIEIFKRAGAPIEDEVRKIPVLMYIDIHSRVVNVPPETADSFIAPYDSPTNSFALQVRTGRKYDGWMLVVNGTKMNPDDCLGALVVYCTMAGEVQVGLIRRGYVSGTYNVANDMYHGEDAPIMQNLKLAYVQPVIWIKPLSP